MSQIEGNPFVYFLHSTKIISLERQLRTKTEEEVQMEEVKFGILCPHSRGKSFRTQMQT
jgi:hypothetical protein